jgi:hypothetical protein
MKHSKTKFTPGPWSKSDNYNVISKAFPKNIMVASITLQTTSITMNEVERSETQANAALISAAPEMFEALEYLMEEQELGPELVSLLEALMVTSRGKKAVTKIQAALKKARGES